MTHVYKKLDNSDNLSFSLIIELMQSSIVMKYSILIVNYDIISIVQNNGFSSRISFVWTKYMYIHFRKYVVNIEWLLKLISFSLYIFIVIIKALILIYDGLSKGSYYNILTNGKMLYLVIKLMVVSWLFNQLMWKMIYSIFYYNQPPFTATLVWIIKI